MKTAEHGKRRIAAWAAIVVAAACVVSPILTTSFLGDDAFNSYVDGWIARHHSTIPGAILAYYQEWDIGRGRFIPLLQILNVCQFHFSHTPFPLKILQCASIAVNVLTLFVLIEQFGFSAKRALLACCIATLTLQTRYAYDPISQYNLHLPLATEAALLSVLFCRRRFAFGSKRDALASILFFATATLFYEVFAPLIVAIAIICLYGLTNKRNAAIAVLPYVGILVAEAAIVGEIRHSVPQPPGGPYSPSITSDYLAGVGRQLLGTIPFSYIVLDPQAVFKALGPTWLLDASVPSVLAAVAVLVAILVVPLEVKRSRSAALAAVGLTLFLAPALIIATSPFYRRTIGLGTPYIVVYAQSFGLAIGATALKWPPLVRHRSARVMVAVCAAFGVYATTVANGLVVQHFTSWRFPRETIVGGLLAGTGAQLRDHARVFLDASYIVNDRFEPGSVWNNANFYRMWSGKDLSLSPIADESQVARAAAVFDLRSMRNESTSGALLVTKLSGDAGHEIIDGLVFERSGKGPTRNDRPALVLKDVSTSDFTLVHSTAHARTFLFRPHCRNLSLDTLTNGSPTQAVVTFGDGFFSDEYDDRLRWRWARAKAVLSIRNPAQKYLRTNFIATVGTVGNASGGLVIATQHAKLRFPLSRLGSAVDIELGLRPGESQELRFTAGAPSVGVAGDSRDLRFRLLNSATFDRTGCAVADEGRRSDRTSSNER